MLLFSSGTFTIDGITVFPDHADPNQFWYLPGPVGLAKLPESQEPQFLLIEYTPDVPAAGVAGVGFLNVTLALVLSDTARGKIIGQIRTQFPAADNPNLAPVPFDEGTVQIVALDMQGSGGTSANLPPGAFEAVQRILGAASPELFGDNNALFDLSLTPDGASILDAAFEDGMAPVGAIYTLKFTGARPAIDVKITADLKRIYESFSIGLTAQAYFVSAGIDATFEKLRQDGTIKVQVTNLTTDAANADKEQWALNLFKDSIMAQWFTPSLSPTTAAAADAPPPALSPARGVAPPAAMGGAGAGGAAAAHPPAVMGGAGGGAPQLGAASGAAAPKPAGAAPAPGAAPTPAAPVAGAPAAGAPAAGAPVAGAPKAAAPTVGAQVAGAAAAAAAAAAAGRPPAGATPAPVPPIANAAGTAAAASSAASPFGVALRLKFVSQDEQKTVEILYDRMDAVQRVYAPQGYFGLLLDQIDRSKHFLKVDGTDPFFKQFAVTVNPPSDFVKIGLLEAHIAMDYGDPTSDLPVKHGEFLFDRTHATQQVWSVSEGRIQSTRFRYTADFKFDPESGWVGEQDNYTIPTTPTDNRVVNLDPHDFLAFMQICVMPDRIDATLVDRIEVALNYTGESGWTTATTLIVNATSAPQFWKLRRPIDKTPGNKFGSFTYATTCFLKGGAVLKNPPVSSSATSVLVSDPFPTALNLVFQPAFNASTQMVVVELNYSDDANDYAFRTTFQINAGAAAATTVRIPIINPQLIQYQYRLTSIDTSNRSTQGTYLTAADPLVIVSAAR